jgi:hypothetical protein
VPQYLIGNLTPEYWLLNPEVGWLSSKDVLGDAVRDLRVRNGALSVFEIADGASPAHIKRVAAAIAAAFKNEPVDTAYRLLDPAQVSELGLTAEPRTGTLGDDELNPTHRNIAKIGAITLGRLAAVIGHSPGDQLSAKEFGQIVTREVQQNRLRVNDKLRKALHL